MPHGPRRMPAAVSPGRPRSESAGSEPPAGRGTVRTGWPRRSRARTSEGGGGDGDGFGPSHLRLAPSGREGIATPRPGPVRAAGCRRWRVADPVRVTCGLHRPGGRGVATPRPGPMRAAGRRRYPSAGPVRVACGLHRPGGRALPLPGPGRWGRRVAGVGATVSPSTRWLRRRRLESDGYPERRVDPSILAYLPSRRRPHPKSVNQRLRFNRMIPL